MGGYGGFVLGLLSLFAGMSEGTPFGPIDGGLMLLVMVFVGYVLGWAVGPFAMDKG